MWLPGEMWLPGKCDLPGNLTSWKIWLAGKWDIWISGFQGFRDLGFSQIFFFTDFLILLMPSLEMRLPGICDFSEESWLPEKCYFLDNVTSFEFSKKIPGNYTWLKILANNCHSCRRYIRTFPSSLIRSKKRQYSHKSLVSSHIKYDIRKNEGTRLLLCIWLCCPSRSPCPTPQSRDPSFRIDASDTYGLGSVLSLAGKRGRPRASAKACGARARRGLPATASEDSDERGGE